MSGTRPTGESQTSSQPGFSANFVIGMAIVVLAFFTVLANISLYQETRGLSDEDAVQRDCIKTSFADLTDALTVRGEFTTQINELRDRELVLLIRGRDLNANQINSIGTDITGFLAPDIKEHPEEIKRLIHSLIQHKNSYREKSVKLTDQFQRLRTRIQDTLDEQNKTPIPPFPGGACGNTE